MRFQKKINNNVALVKDSAGIDCVVIGKGIGFGKKPGDIVTEKEITRRFFSDEAQPLDSLLQTVVSIRPEILEIASEISHDAERKLDIKFSNHHYIILADHIDYAITRIDEGIDFNDSARWEVKRLFPREYRIARESIQKVNERLGIQLPKSEEVFITYHYVNAQNNENKMNETIKMTKLINFILEYIEESFKISLDEDAFSYMRMVNHLRYFIIRKIHGEGMEGDDDKTLYNAVQVKCPREHEVTEKIAAHLIQNENFSISHDEKMFLTLHIWRVLEEIKKKEN